MNPNSDPKVNKTNGRDLRPSSMASMVIGTHSFQHMYTEGFLVIIPAIYSSLGLTPILVGLISPVRQALSGLFTIGGGILVDRFQSRRGFFLGLSLALMGLGYLFVSPTPFPSINWSNWPLIAYCCHQDPARRSGLDSPARHWSATVVRFRCWESVSVTR